LDLQVLSVRCGMVQ